MDAHAQVIGTAASWLFAVVWIAALIVLFLPLLVVGYAARAIGTMFCNTAYRIQDLLEYLGRKIGP